MFPENGHQIVPGLADNIEMIMTRNPEEKIKLLGPALYKRLLEFDRL